MSEMTEQTKPRDAGEWSDDQRRVGRFKIARQLIHEDPDAVRLALSGMIVVRAEAVFVWGAIEYTAISEHFDVIDYGQIVPEYQAVIERIELKNDDGEPEFRHLIKGWERVPR